MKTKVLFIGAYGIENVGDDLPMLVMMDNLQKLAPKETTFEFHSLSRHPSKWEEKKYNIIQHQNLEYQNRENAKDKWFKGLNYHDNRDEFYNFLELIKSMDVLIIGAGNFIIDINIDIFKGPIPLIWWYVHLAKLYNKKVFLYGLSAATLQSEYAQLLTKEIIDRSDVVTLRDSYTKKYLQSLGIKKKLLVLPDPTLGVIQNTKVSLKKRDKIVLQKTQKQKIILGIRDLSFLEDKGKKVFESIVHFINSHPSYSYIFIPQSTYSEDDDRKTAHTLSKKINKTIDTHIIKNRYTPKELINIYTMCDITIAIRLHSAVFSHIATTPAIAISYLPKVQAFMKDFKTSKQVIDIKDISSKKLARKVRYIQNNPSLRTSIQKQTKQKKKKVKEYTHLLLSLLKG